MEKAVAPRKRTRFVTRWFEGLQFYGLRPSPHPNRRWCTEDRPDERHLSEGRERRFWSFAMGCLRHRRHYVNGRSALCVSTEEKFSELLIYTGHGKVARNSSLTGSWPSRANSSSKTRLYARYDSRHFEGVRQEGWLLPLLNERSRTCPLAFPSAVCAKAAVKPWSRSGASASILVSIERKKATRNSVEMS